MIIRLKVIPNAPKNSLESFEDGVLKVKVSAVPDRGKANDAIIKLLADVFDLPKREITIISGQTSRLKKIELPVTEEEIKSACKKT